MVKLHGFCLSIAYMYFPRLCHLYTHARTRTYARTHARTHTHTLCLFFSFSNTHFLCFFVPFTIQDTAGQERYHALGPIYYRDSQGAIVVYDITDQDSFIKVSFRIEFVTAPLSTHSHSLNPPVTTH